MWSSTGDPSGPAAFEIAFGEPEPLLSRLAAALEAFPDIDAVLRQLILIAVRSGAGTANSLRAFPRSDVGGQAVAYARAEHRIASSGVKGAVRC
jgi:hypothetical protein